MRPPRDHCAMPAENLRPISLFARPHSRRDSRPFGIKQNDRLFHLHLIGKTGAGKSTLIETLVTQDLKTVRGFALIDPHGDLVERVANRVPYYRRDETVYFNVPDLSQPYGYNPLRYVVRERRSLCSAFQIGVCARRASRDAGAVGGLSAKG